MLYHDKLYKAYTLKPDTYTQGQAMEKLSHCIHLFKSGHEQPLAFYPFVKDYKKVFTNGPQSFSSEINRMRTAEKSREAFSDLYIEKADENGYFDESRYPEFEANTLFLFSDLNL